MTTTTAGAPNEQHQRHQHQSAWLFLSKNLLWLSLLLGTFIMGVWFGRNHDEYNIDNGIRGHGHGGRNVNEQQRQRQLSLIDPKTVTMRNPGSPLPTEEHANQGDLFIKETLDPCVVDLLSRHSIPQDLPPKSSDFGFDAVFITHYTKLGSRKPVMIERVQQALGMDPIFVEDFDAEVLTDEDVKCFGDSEAQMAYINRVSKKGEISLTMKHFTVYFYMVQQSLDNVLVLEDDATFISDWTNEDSVWQQIRRTLPTTYDLLFLSGCCNLHKQGKKITDHLYLAQGSRVASMYLISQKGARNMLRSLPMVSVIDFHMNYAANHKGNKWMTKIPGFRGPRTVDIEMYHSEPWLSKQIAPDGLKSTWQA